jgi:hypothetical protein
VRQVQVLKARPPAFSGTAHTLLDVRQHRTAMSKKDTLLSIGPGLLVLFFACYTFFARFYLYSDYDAELSKSAIRTLESSGWIFRKNRY